MALLPSDRSVGGLLPARLLELAQSLCEEVAGFDPSAVDGDDAAVLAEQLARTAKVCAGAAARLAPQASACGAHKRRGFADAADWLARTMGTARNEASVAMATVTAAADDAEMQAALVAGVLSLAQADVIVRTTAECPGAAPELLELASRTSLAALRDEARRRRLAAVDADELHRRQHRAREFRHWRDEVGMIRLAGALPPEVGVPIVNRLDAETDRIRRAASEPEPRAAHAADALVALLAGKGGGKRSATDLVLVCDVAAYRRGHTVPGERAHIVGGGPVPVPVIRELADDAFLKVVLHDGVRIETVAHLGRHIPAELRTALELGPSPHFDGVECVEEGCGRRYGLEWDHVDPWPTAASRPTTTSGRAAGPITGPRPNATVRPACWGCPPRPG